MAKIQYTRGYKSPGVAYYEKEILPLITGVNQLTIGIVGTADKGPVGKNISIHSQRELQEVFGEVSSEHLGLLAANIALLHSDNIIFNRVVSAAAEFGSGTAEVTVLNEVVDSEGTPVPADPATFNIKTKSQTDNLNGGTVQFRFDTEKGVVAYRLLGANGKIIEESIGYTLDDPEHVAYLPKLLNSRSDHIELEVEGTLPTSEQGFSDIDITIEGGNSGTDITATEIIGEGSAGIKAFMSPDTVDVSTLITPGWSHEEIVIDALEELTKYRGDVMVIIDPPQGLDAKTAVSWTNGEYELTRKLDNEWFSVYYPWVQIYEGNELVSVPPSVVVAAQWAYSDVETDCWFAPAGYGNDTNRGRGYLAEVVDTEIELTKEDRDLLYGDGNVINPIAKFIGKGIILFGNRTTRRTNFGEAESMMSSLNVRRLCNYIRKIVVSISYTELFNPNDRFTWESWRLKIETQLDKIMANRGIERYRVVMDGSTVTYEDIRNGRMPGIIYVQPMRVAEFIPITFVVTDMDIYFNEGQPLEIGPEATMITHAKWEG